MKTLICGEAAHLCVLFRRLFWGFTTVKSMHTSQGGDRYQRPHRLPTPEKPLDCYANSSTKSASRREWLKLRGLRRRSPPPLHAMNFGSMQRFDVSYGALPTVKPLGLFWGLCEVSPGSPQDAWNRSAVTLYLAVFAFFCRYGRYVR